MILPELPIFQIVALLVMTKKCQIDWFCHYHSFTPGTVLGTTRELLKKVWIIVKLTVLIKAMNLQFEQYLQTIMWVISKRLADIFLTLVWNYLSAS